MDHDSRPASSVGQQISSGAGRESKPRRYGVGEMYIPVGRVGELAEGEMKAADMGGRAVVLAYAGGEYRVFMRECPHEGADLLDGDLLESKVRCENHSYQFDLASGECV